MATEQAARTQGMGIRIAAVMLLGSTRKEVLHMRQKMLKGLRRRSEQTAREREAGTWQPAAATVPGTESPVSWQPPAHGE